MSVTLLEGDCQDLLPTLPADSVHCVVTSPPYWGLRDYGTATWEGGDPACDHRAGSDYGEKSDTNRGSIRGGPFKASCGKCGARRLDQQLGLEATPEAYLAAMVGVFREVRRVLRDDGTLWCNMGDSFDDKRLVGMPWRLAFALQADGWYLRADIIWAKPNPMPESVTDRPTKAHEYVFLLSKSARYFYDADAVREPHTGPPPEHYGSVRSLESRDLPTQVRGSIVTAKPREYNAAGRNLRSVWTIPSAPFPDAHFATFPSALASRCIQAGSSERGCCAACGAPWVRQVDRTPMVLDRSPRTHVFGRTRSSGTMLAPPTATTTGWAPTCACAAPTTPCTVLDPFAGSGTTGQVAEQLGRHSILIELSPAYVALADTRTAQRGLFTQ